AQRAPSRGGRRVGRFKLRDRGAFSGGAWGARGGSDVISQRLETAFHRSEMTFQRWKAVFLLWGLPLLPCPRFSPRRLPLRAAPPPPPSAPPAAPASPPPHPPPPAATRSALHQAAAMGSRPRP